MSVYIVSIVADPFNLMGGYSFLWLTLLYIIGAYIRKYELYKVVKQKILLIIMSGLFLFTWGWKLGIGMLSSKLIGDEVGAEMFVSYISPTILGIAVILLLLFTNIEIKSRIKKYVKFLASSAFSVYLIHTHPLIFEHVIKGRFAWIAELSMLVIPIAVLGVAVVIFGIGIIIDKIRIGIFEVCRIKLLAQKIEGKK